MWYRSESGEKPLTVDKTSSKIWVYMTRNVEIERRDLDDDEFITYVYDEIKITKEDYAAIVASDDTEKYKEKYDLNDSEIQILKESANNG